MLHMIDTKKLFFLLSFFATDFLASVELSEVPIFFEESLHTQNYQSFFRWDYGELF